MRTKKRCNSVLSFPCTTVPSFNPPGTETGSSLHEHATSWKFVVVGDTHGDNRGANNTSCINDVVVRAIADDIVKENPDFILVAGDLVNGWFRNGGTDYAVQYANWKNAMKSVYEAKIRAYPIRGNHDSGPERLALPPLPARYEPSPDTPILLKKAFTDAFSEDYIPKNGPVEEKGLTYSFVHKNAFIIGLDQFTGGGHRVNQMWLNRQLAENGSIHVFVFGHEPAFDTSHRDNLAFYPKRRDAFWNSIGRAGARMYFCGHEHLYNRAMIPDNGGNEIRQIVVGTGGGTSKAWSDMGKSNKKAETEYHNSDHSGYALVTVTGPQVTVVWKALVISQPIDVWKILDEFTYSVLTERETRDMKV